MTWKRTVLVIANQTAPSDELLAHLGERSEAVVHLVVPTTPYRSDVPSGREAAEHNLGEALERLRAAGLEASGEVGDSDPVTAVREAWDPTRFDAIVVATLPTGASRWLRIDVPRRLERMTGVPVEHVVATPRREYRAGPRKPPPERHGMLTPLAALEWGADRPGRLPSPPQDA